MAPKRSHKRGDSPLTMLIAIHAQSSQNKRLERVHGKKVVEGEVGGR